MSEPSSPRSYESIPDEESQSPVSPRSVKGPMDPMLLKLRYEIYRMRNRYSELLIPKFAYDLDTVEGCEIALYSMKQHIVEEEKKQKESSMILCRTAICDKLSLSPEARQIVMNGELDKLIELSIIGSLNVALGSSESKSCNIM